ncbi:MAG: prepilin peptidase, partial [Pseudomonas chlororaphis]
MSLTEVLASYPLVFVASVLVLGLIVGSFLNVLIWRLPKMLERDWHAQARDILGLPDEPVGPT